MSIVKKSASAVFAGLVLGAVVLSSATGCAVAPQGSDQPSSEPSSTPPSASSSHGAIAAGEVSHTDAKLFDWNSCYSADSSGLGSLMPNGCLEQWGSYPAECESTFYTVAHAPGQRCKNVCNAGTCADGCFSNYDTGNSLSDSASFYSCVNNPPTFLMALEPPFLTVTHGSGQYADATIQTLAVPDSVSESIALSVTGLPSGVEVYLGAGGGATTSVTTGGHMDFTVKALPSVAPGVYPFMAVGTGSVSFSQAVPGTLVVN